jgi:hypothetical protein
MFLVLALNLCGCAGTPDRPAYPDDICEIFRENRDWYRSAHASYVRWRIPIPSWMQTMLQEAK